MEVVNILLNIIPTAVLSLLVFFIEFKVQRSMRKKDEAAAAESLKRQQADSEMRKMQLLEANMQIATLKLSEATAMALRDGKVDGVMEDAMKECEAAKKEYYEHINKQYFGVG